MASHLVYLETEALGNSEMALLWSFWTALESLPCFFPLSLSLFRSKSIQIFTPSSLGIFTCNGKTELFKFLEISVYRVVRALALITQPFVP